MISFERRHRRSEKKRIKSRRIEILNLISALIAAESRFTDHRVIALKEINDGTPRIQFRERNQI